MVPPSPFQATLGLLLALGLGSCVSYTERTARAVSDYEAGNFEEARSEFEKLRGGNPGFLDSAEAGTVALTAGDWEIARAELDAAAVEVKEIEDKALLSVSDLGETLVSFAINDTVKTYTGEGYERVTLHVMLAMTYLATGPFNGVWVEARRANKLLESEETLYEKQYAAGGMGHLVSALAYELNGEPGEAYIDYKRMAEKGVGLDLAGRALVRLGTQLGRDDELPGWIEQFGSDLERPEGAASIVLLAGVGLSPYKVQVGFSLPTPDGVVQWAVPSYVRRPQQITSLKLLEVESDTRVASSLIEDLGQVAMENLDDRIVWLAAKSAVRSALKYQVTKQLSEQHGAGGWIAGALFTIATERADLRSWLTLPDTWQAARMFVAPGTHTFAVEAVGGGTQHLGTYELEPGETMVVIGRTLGRQQYLFPLGGKRLDAAALAESGAPLAPEADGPLPDAQPTPPTAAEAGEPEPPRP